MVLLASGYVSSGQQPASALVGFKVMITVIPIVALVIGLLCFLKYPLKPQRVAEIQSRLQQFGA
jgi:Na+/melibiose symporter-like transporter